jgi:GNAT superfamily N-acetyltransferase
MPAGAYYPYQRGVIQQLLDRGAEVVVARDADAPEMVYGWLCCERSGREFTLHYVYVKLPFRELGLGHAMLDEALELYGDGAEELVYTHDPARGRTAEGRVNTERRKQAERLGFSWRPIDEHLRSGKEAA